MVYAFIIHTILPGTCKVLYSRRFVSELSTDDATERSKERLSPQDIRQQEKQLIDDIAAHVHSEYQFRRAVAGALVDIDMLRFGNDDALPKFESGIIRLAAKKYFQEEKSAIWLGAGNSGFTLVCDKGENLMLAENVLKLLIRFLQEHMRILAQQTENILKSDRITMVVEQFLPFGVLLFMNNRVIRQLEKELDMALKG